MPEASLEDRVLIREVYGRYAIAVIRQDGPEWLECWSSDATWKTPHFEVHGRPALAQTWDATWTDFASVSVFNEVGPIQFAGDRASALSNVLEVITLRSGGLVRMVGLYADEFIREEGEWRFARREYSLLSQDAATGN